MLEVTARSAADILGINQNSSALFYRNIHELIRYHLALDVSEFHHERINHFGGSQTEYINDIENLEAKPNEYSENTMELTE